jgi:LPPG:FO 2-phospho-L-lactate transferase
VGVGGAARAGTNHDGADAPEVVVLAGGTGGAKLARGMLDVVGAERLTVIANTGDDIEIYGAHVSPDPDLVSFWLADAIDERGWGL